MTETGTTIDTSPITKVSIASDLSQPKLTEVKFNKGDTCVLKANPGLIGEVARTHHDFNTHEPLEDELIISHVPVAENVIKSFFSFGEPPRGYVFVSWAKEEYGSSLVDEGALSLIDRPFYIGDTVKRNDSDSTVGTVINVQDFFTLDPIARAEKDSLSFNHVSALDDSFSHRSKAGLKADHRLPPPVLHSRPEELLFDIPGSELKRVEDFEAGDYVVSQDWLGAVQDNPVDICLLLDNDSVVVVEEADEVELVLPELELDAAVVAFPDLEGFRRPDILGNDSKGLTSFPPRHLFRGQYVVTNKPNILKGRWLRGAYDPNCPPQGRILDIRSRRLEVKWLCPNAFAPRRLGESPPRPSVRPYENLGSYRNLQDIRRNKAISLFDSSKSWINSLNYPNLTARISPGHRFQAGDLVKFRDSPGATVKYQGGRHGHFHFIQKADSFGIDMNEFEVLVSKRTITVQWQDASTTQEDSISLRPFQLPEAELCPGEVVTLKEGMKQIKVGMPADTATDFNEMQFFEGDFRLQPKKIGIVQSVDSKERLVRLRLFQSPQIELLEQGNVLKAGSFLGQISDTVEEVSLYEVMPQPALLRHRRDLVILPPERAVPEIVQSLRAEQTTWQYGTSTLSYIRSLRSHHKYHHLRNIAKHFIERNDGPLPPLSAALEDSTMNIPIDWIGEVVNIGLDGLLTVRLGAADNRDVKVPFERVLMAIDDDAEFGDNSSTFSTDDSWLIHGRDDDIEVLSEASAIDEEIEYEGGRRLDNDSADEAWMTDEDMATDDDMPSLIDPEGDVRMEESESIYDTGHQRVQTGPPSMDVKALGQRSPVPLTDLNQPLLDTAFQSRQRSRNSELSASPPPNPCLSNLYQASTTGPPAPFTVLESPPPMDHYIFASDAPDSLSPAFLRRISREHHILSSSLPKNQIFVRTYESRLDLIRCLIVGPTDTPYELAPFVIDMRLPPSYPLDPPVAHFHSWTGGLGRINPNLYEEGKICLSLLGTWPAKSEGENWTPNANILQVLISLMGLVLVRRPFYNEAGFETFDEEKIYVNESQQYNEKVFVIARGFIKHALVHPVKGFEDVLSYLYLPRGQPNANASDDRLGLLRATIDRSQSLMAASTNLRGQNTDTLLDGAGQTGDPTRAFLTPLSQGALVMLRKTISTLDQISNKADEAMRTRP